MAAGLAGCGGSDRPDAAATAPAPGEKLVLRREAPAEVSTCPDCGRPAGPAHACSATVFCPTCKVDASKTGHVCRVSRYCADCGCEAALAGHICGETRFDPASMADVEIEEPVGGGEAGG